jgi:16S rRNA (cytosine1402-N4)-methyltransferase
LSDKHVPVLLDETLDALLDGVVRADGVWFDATFGRGGHSRALLQRLDPDARLVVLDRDLEAYDEACELAAEDARVAPIHGSFASIGEHLQPFGVGALRGAIMDLGVSSPQLDDAVRGFSFMSDGPLDMRMDRGQTMTAASWLNRAHVGEIETVLRELGEERHARRIARAIIDSRPLATTRQLAELVEAAQPARVPGKHPATRVFQAVRMHVNDELGQLEAGLAALFGALGIGGRIAVISFHSLEDRVVKRTFRTWSKPVEMPRRLPVRASQTPPPARLMGGPVRASAGERERNPRARSATLRVVERVT